MKAIAILIGVATLGFVVLAELDNRGCAPTWFARWRAERDMRQERTERVAPPVVVDDGRSMTWLEQCRLRSLAGDRETREEQRYLFAQRQGLAPSGVPEVDEAVRAAAALSNMQDRAYTPPYWRQRHDDGRAWLRANTPSGLDEQRVGASEAKAPTWTGKPLGVSEDQREARPRGVSAGMAMRRFVFGMDESERL